MSDVWRDLWRNKPLLIAVVAGILIVIYILYRSNKGANDKTTTTTTSGATPVDTDLPPTVTVTVNNTPGGTTTSGGQKYTVIAGDTLWGIAQKFYQNGALWPKIYTANQSVIGSNPDLIYPGQQYTIP